VNQPTTQDAVLETLPDELIIEDPHALPEDETQGHEQTAVRTAAFLADRDTSTFLLADTVQSLIAAQQVQSAVVDLSTEAGASIARLVAATPGIEYRIFDTVPLDGDGIPSGLAPLLEGSAGTVPFDAEDICAIDANIVLIPAAAIDAGPGVDVSDGTVAGAVLAQLQPAGLPCLLVLPPESGLRRQEDGSYVRLTLKIQE
jgi:hypothetical protein